MPALIPLFAAILPFILWPVEILFPYPHIIEELGKALLIFFLLKSGSLRQKILGAALIGFLFAFSENVLYMLNIFSGANTQDLLLRFVITMPMHIATSVVIMAISLIDKRLIFIGVILAGLIHYFFNSYVSSLAI
ncbi:MAG: PrsW family glutamic-type intramembrane protease [bacterium]|nr:PrsW family glutamic-type intramembrane protease [bacterium]